MTPQNKKIRVLLCNQHTLFREGMQALFRNTPIEIVGVAATAEEALRLLKRLWPDVVLMDVHTPDASGSEVTRRIKAIDPHVEVLILTLEDDDILIASCLEAGATGFIRKDDRPLQLRRAINMAYRKAHAA